MRLLPALVLAFSSVGAAAAPAADGQGRQQWTWTSAEAGSRPLTVRIVRGSYRIVRRAGPVRVSMSVKSPLGNAAAVSFRVETGARVTISDVYPAGAVRTWKECLPPEDSRGDFWSSDAVIDALITAPPSVPVAVEVMDLRKS